jgi:hypothetical protein
MKIKKKVCDKCGLEAFIWSSRGGKKLCKKCASTGVAINKPTIKSAKPIAPRSQKRLLEERIYSVKRKVFLQNHSMCEAHIQGICTGLATECHHKYSGKDRNQYFVDETTWVAICRNCHNWIHANSKNAREIGLLK